MELQQIKAGDIIRLAAKNAGILEVGQQLLAEDVNDILTLLNMMIGSWNAKRWMIYHLVERSVVATGEQIYTVGPGGQFNVPQRPDAIQYAFVRITSQPSPAAPSDVYLSPIKAKEDWASIVAKLVGNFPTHFFYDTDWPMGKIYFWPIPQSGIYEMHIFVQHVLSQFPDVTGLINLPSVYYEALVWNLTIRIRSSWNRKQDPAQVELAKLALAAVRNANAQIPQMRLPGPLRWNRSAYNIYSDTFNQN